MEVIRTLSSVRAKRYTGMTNAKKKGRIIDKKRLLRQADYLTRPPRLEGAAKNKMMNPVRKKKKTGLKEKGGA